MDPIDPSAFTKGRAPTDDVWETIYTQRAIRYWRTEPVPRELLEQVVSAAGRAPSGTNTQPWVFVVVDDAERLARIAEALRAIYERAEPLRQYLERGEASDDPSEQRMARGARAFFTRLERAPALLLPCLYRVSSPTNDPQSLLAGSSIYQAVQNAMLAARALGLGTVMTTAQAMIERPLRELLALPDDAHPVAFIPIGFPDADFGPTKRKPVAEILRWNAW